MFLSYDGLNLDEIVALNEIGLISGVTTNLTLVNSAKKNSGKSREEIISPLMQYCSEKKLNFSVQVESKSPTEIKLEGLQLQKIADDKSRFFVKVPANFANLEVIRELTREGVNVNATCVTSHMQGRMVAAAGAKIVSFFWGKMCDQGLDPYAHVSNYKKWADEHFKADRPILLVGSVRQLASIESAYLAGAEVVTTSLQNIKNLAGQLASDQAAELFYETNI
jgi:transaldolase